jgi:hypothetical protein
MLKRDDAVLFNDGVKADPRNGNRISAAIPAGGSGEQVQLTIRTAEGKKLIAAGTKNRIFAGREQLARLMAHAGGCVQPL